MTRPKKVVLLYCKDENRRHELSFLLQTRTFYLVAGMDEMRHGVDAALFVHDGRESQDAARLVDAVLPEVSISLIIRLSWLGHASYPGNTFPIAHLAKAREIIESVRVLAIRKRGPKKIAPWTCRALQVTA